MRAIISGEEERAKALKASTLGNGLRQLEYQMVGRLLEDEVTGSA